jgi:predicted metal-dependent hydrolase
MELPFKKLAINLAKTCWGSCTSQKHIALNASLLFFEPECLNYVIVHECAHLQHMNHSQRFWKLVAHYCPNYAMIKAHLKHKSKTLPLWLYDATYLELPQLITSTEETR